MENEFNFEQFIEYLDIIELPNIHRKKVESIYNFYNDLCPETIQDVFISEYIAENLREYENLWFFSENYLMEAKRFIKEDDFDITLNKDVYYWSIKKTNYDFQKATDDSRAFVHVDLNRTINADLKASKENCDHLKEIVLKYFHPKLK